MRAGRLVKTKGTQTYTIEPEASLRAAATVMHHQQIGSLLVVDNHNQAVGLVTERDIVTAVCLHGSATAAIAVSGVMRGTVPQCDDSDTLEHVMAVMTNQRTRHVVVNGQTGVVGILSIGDVVKYRLVELEEETRMTLNYIWSGR